MSDKFAVPNLPGATGEREAETEEGSDSRGCSALYRDDHLGEETECEEGDSDDDEETETEETDYNSRYGEDTECEEEDEEPSHPDAPNPPAPDDALIVRLEHLQKKYDEQKQVIQDLQSSIDPEQLAEIVAAAIESATAPLTMQIDELTDQINGQEGTIGSLQNGLTTAEKQIEQRDAQIQELTGTVRRKDIHLAEMQQTVATVRAANKSQQRYYETRQAAGLQTTRYQSPASVCYALDSKCNVEDMYALSELAETALNHIIEHEPILLKPPDDLDERLLFLAMLNAWYTKAYPDREPLKLSSPAPPSHSLVALGTI